MKRRNIFAFLMVLSAVIACDRVEEITQPDQEQEVVEKVEMTVNAVIEADDTKTVMVDGEVEGLKKVLWQPGDAIGVKALKGDMMSGIEKFTTAISSPEAESEFEGDIEFAPRYIAFYPYADTLGHMHEAFYFDMPVVQKYVKGSFDPQAAPMVAAASYGERFNFQNLCGILALNLTGNEAVESIMFSAHDANGNSMPIVGRYGVHATTSELSMVPDGNNGCVLTLKCDRPVQLDANSPTPFYIMLPPGTYNSFYLIIKTSEGRVMFRQGKTPLTLERSRFRETGILEYMETLDVDLSKEGTANSYIVSKGGLYSFDASVMGNGYYGFVDGVKFHTESPVINPVKAQLLWEDHTDVIENPTLEGSRVQFLATGIEGNALIAVKDEIGNILWSWHIWVTDKPQDQVYVNSTGRYTMQDRNLGATRAEKPTNDTEWYETKGLLYQWGRKDPFSNQGYYGTSHGQGSLSDAVWNPNNLYASGSENWTYDQVDSLWNKHQKTIYDPCPVGYTVPPTNAWRSFQANESDVWYSTDGWNVSSYQNRGLEFIYDGVNSTYYPTVGWLGNYGDSNYYTDSECFLWSSENISGEKYDANGFYFYYSVHGGDYTLQFTKDRYKSWASAVRCMKDTGFEDSCKPLVRVVKVKDLHSQGASFEATVVTNGLAAVTERGFVVGLTPDIDVDNALQTLRIPGMGKFEAIANNLEHSTTYYVRAFASNEYGTAYSKAMPFFTPYEGNATDLSSNGTANCYIVRPIYSEYAFNATVKGNSQEPVGDIHHAEVIWECAMTKGTNFGDVVTDVELKGNMIHFMLPSNPQPGNAVIVVKDIYDTILWSWHIWVVDFDPVATQKKLFNNSVIMDRNLGAIGVEQGTAESYGLFYQWGRKDPFIHPHYNYNTAPSEAIRYEYYDYYDDNISRAVRNPNVVYNDASWGGDYSLWGAQKTKYDPCPSGWKVSEKGIWEGVRRGAYQYGYFTVDPSYSDSYVYLPASGYTEGASDVYDLHCSGHLWSSTRGYWIDVYIDNYEIYIRDDSSWGRSVDYLYGVRCMKESPKQTGDNEGYKENGDYEW